MSEELVILPVKLTPEDRQIVHDVAEAEKTNASDLVRSLLTDYMKGKSEAFTGKVSQHGGRRSPTKSVPA